MKLELGNEHSAGNREGAIFPGGWVNAALVFHLIPFAFAFHDLGGTLVQRFCITKLDQPKHV